MPDDENLAQKAPPGPDNWIGFSVDSGAYFIETNGGGKLDLGKVATMKYDPTISAYRANAASAAYSRVLAQSMYGGKRPFGYGFGGSGGAFRTIGSFENTRGVWDGVVPFVMGSNMAIPNMFTVRIRAMRIIGDKFPQIIDAASPGGSGDIYAGLTPLEAEALREVTRMGFEPQAWTSNPVNTPTIDRLGDILEYTTHDARQEPCADADCSAKAADGGPHATARTARLFHRL